MPQWCGLLNIGVGLVKNSGLHWIVTPTGDMGVGTRFHEGGGNHSGFHQVEGSHGSGIHSRSRHKASRSSRNFVSKRVRGCSDWWYKIKPLFAAFLVPAHDFFGAGHKKGGVFVARPRFLLAPAIKRGRFRGPLTMNARRTEVCCFTRRTVSLCTSPSACTPCNPSALLQGPSPHS